MVSADVVEYRPAFGRVLAVVVAVLGLGGLVTGLVADAGATWPYVAPVLLVVLWVWAAYWRPAVLVSPAGVELRNVTRTIELPWPTIQRVDTRYALTLHTAYGDYAAWAAPAPSRARVATSGKDDVANLPGSTYVGPRGLLQLKGHPKVVQARRIAHDREAQRRMWEISEEATGVRFIDGAAR